MEKKLMEEGAKLKYEHPGTEADDPEYGSHVDEVGTLSGYWIARHGGQGDLLTVSYPYYVTYKDGTELLHGAAELEEV